MGANVLRGHVSQDIGKLFVMRVSLLCFPTGQDSHLAFSPAVAVKNLPAGQHTTRPRLPAKAASEMISVHLVEHHV